MKLLIFLSLFFYQTLHANILYPLPTHKFDFSISTYNYNSSNPSKKRALASVIDKVKTFFNKPPSTRDAGLAAFRITDAFHTAVVFKNLKGVRNALAKGADPTYNINIDTLYKDSPKLTKTEQKIIELVKAAQYVHKLNNELFYGVDDKNLDKVVEYLKQGADPNIRHYRNEPHLLQVALRNTHLIQELPLTEEHEKVVEALLKHGADPNLYFKDLPALHLAVFLRSPKIVKLLIKYGANVNLKYKKDVTPLLLVVNPLKTEKNFERYVDIGFNEEEFKLRNEENLELDKEITQALLDAGADINEKTLGGNTLLVNATIEGHSEFALFLVEKGANLEEAIEIIHKHQDLLKNKKIPESFFSEYLNSDKTFQLNKNNAALEFLENLKTLQQDFKKQIDEIKSPKNDKTSCPGAFG